MRAILLDTDPETTVWLEAACMSARILPTLVGSLATLERVAKQADHTDFLILECVRGHPEEINRCQHVLRHAYLDVAIVYARLDLLRELEPLARGQVVGLDRDMPFPALVRLLRDRHEQALLVRARGRRTLSPRQRQIASCVARDLSQAQVARELDVHVGTVKRQVGRILDKLGLTTTAELKIALRFLPDDA